MGMKQILRQLKPFDFILIGLTLLLSFTPAAFTYLHSKQQTDEPYLIASIRINGEVVEEFKLSKDTPHKEVTYHPKPGQYNIIEVDGERIRDKEDNSPDQIAVNTGWISRPGEIAVCLPHNLIIEIRVPEDQESDEEEELILPI
ncbi:NusG domain II-containing protein [Streptococcus sp. zg-86]|uniref:NusG domain II-containing protein n=1 Tax=Streptococcus zhangguiae TaxID=2664091 RepID=A0A6I4RA23_9STRE|nr:MULTISPECIES: NusG domain II-containing protein [unclassified Streptococcus]MTB64346.1 NusG domain II-containing protein [Streptococcus sp. zg-86]MTB90656.1 NusG domain II-containing protein [Streptococcus sp. zg-36]MWV56349.1 NusG domain II-containing protein [Streptococcus sp. zg-70]